jgi:hypothetical protein
LQQCLLPLMLLLPLLTLLHTATAAAIAAAVQQVTQGSRVAVCADDLSRGGDAAMSVTFHPGDYVRIGNSTGSSYTTVRLRACEGVNLHLVEPYTGPTAEGLPIMHKNHGKVRVCMRASDVVTYMYMYMRAL